MYKIITGVFRYIAVLALTFAATANIAAGSDTGMDVVAMGGGAIDSVTFQSGMIEDVTFTFFAGYDKDRKPEGSFHFKRGYTGESTTGKISAVLSTEISSIETEFDDEKGCPSLTMTGIAKLIAHWRNKPALGEKFTLKVWDCDGYSDATDMIWFEIRRPNDNVRPGLTLLEPAMVLKGNILIQ
jgi:hypothetical protein